MTNWVKKMKLKYEKYRNDTLETDIPNTKSPRNIVEIRKSYFEKYSNSENFYSSLSVKKTKMVAENTIFRSIMFHYFKKGKNASETIRKICNLHGEYAERINFSVENSSIFNENSSDEELSRFNSVYESSESDTGSNTDRKPSKIVNSENICIYVDSDPECIYGSFRRRPKFHRWPNLKGSENEVITRLKARENEFQSVQRYESILRPPLYQHVVVSKHQDEFQNISGENVRKSSHVSNMVEIFNQKSNVNLHQENMIDFDLINSIRQDDRISFSEGIPFKLLPELQNTRNKKWTEMEQVQSKNIIKGMTTEEIRFQESQFEIISSEASYNRSLSVLVDRFYNSPKMSLVATENFTPVIKPHQKEHLFSNILKIYSVSSRFLADLEKRFCKSVKIVDLCDIVATYAINEFEVYVPYIQNQKFQSDAYIELKKDPQTCKVIKELENQSECCSLNLDSFLLLPMQRLLRILLLLKAVKGNMKGNHREDFVDKAIFNVDKVINKCSNRKMLIDERQRMLELCRYLYFKKGQSKVNFSKGKLIYEGEVKRSVKNYTKRIWPNFLSFKNFWFILTSEFLLMTIASKGKEVIYTVEEYFNRSSISLEEDNEDDTESNFRFKLIIRRPPNSSESYLILTKSKEENLKWMSLLQNK